MRQVVSLLRLCPGRLTASYQPTHIGPYTLDLASSFRSAAEMAGLEFMVESTLPSNFVAWVDRDKYEKIMYNLLSNVRRSFGPWGPHFLNASQAIKYTKKGFVRVSASLEANYFVLRVADSGLGIPKAEAQNIWGKFNRVTSAQARSIEGAGIGLAFTLELVKIHKGDVDVDSEPGQGRCAPPALLTPPRADICVAHFASGSRSETHTCRPKASSTRMRRTLRVPRSTAACA
jgi:signal transduction histidine kinase